MTPTTDNGNDTRTSAPSELLWEADDTVLATLDSDPGFRERLIWWLEVHRLSPWHVLKVGITGSANGLAVQAVVWRVENGHVIYELLIKPLVCDPPGARPGWKTTQ